MSNRWCWTALLLFGIPLAANAQVADGGAQSELIRQLLDRVETLENRVAELEGRSVKPDPPQTVAAAESSPPAMAQGHSEGAPVGKSPEEQAAVKGEAEPTYPSLKIQGFSDFNFSATDQKDTHSGFSEGQFVLHFTSALSPRVNYFGEVSVTARTDAGTGTPPAPGFNFEVERSIIRYDQSDYFKVSFGRFHTPINWWNTEFHHGQWLQTTISRPEMVELGGSFIPVHFVGALVEGALPTGALNLNYDFGLGNGRSSVLSRAGDAGDLNDNRAWLLTLFAKPTGLFGFQVGGSVYRDKITLFSGRDFREWITSGHIVWQRENPEFIAEVANVNHQQVGGGTAFNSQAFYVQVAYRLPWFEKLWKPYYRYEYIHIPLSDIVFQGVPDLSGSTVGLRYDISSFAAIKAEYRNDRRLPGVPHTNGAFLQTSFTF